MPIPKSPIVLVTFAAFDSGHARIGKALIDAGVEIRLAPKLGHRSEPELAELLKGVSGAIVSTDPFTAEVIAGAPDLRIIARSGVGYDTVDIAAATRHGVQVVTTPGANDRSVADHAMAMLLSLLRRVPELDAGVRRGEWNRTGPYVPRQLSGMTVGVVGYGAIGRRVADRLRGFEVELLVHDPMIEPGGPVESVALHELLRRSQVVTLHTPLNAATRQLINADTLALMRPDSVLVNTSRGEVVDQPALAAALTEGRIAGAALDVLDSEPPERSPLFEMSNVVLSPHNGGLSDVSIHDMLVRCVDSVLAVLAGGVAPDLLNTDVLDTLAGGGKAAIKNVARSGAGGQPKQAT